MTIYVRELVAKLKEKYGQLSTDDFADKLFEIGVVDHTLCKVLAVRDYVAVRVREGEKKIDAMWKAAEHFSCSYEYIRKCIYYYTDVNIE
ncbi:hypothetical protein LJC45_02080 [Alistipes sp. OttesenSCG-928-B03]|nr:hypothetical protein [Alistipes sp. OttesenSCG-928-B03]